MKVNNLDFVKDKTDVYPLKQKDTGISKLKNKTVLAQNQDIFINNPAPEIADQVQNSQAGTGLFSSIRNFVSEVTGRVRDVAVRAYESVSNIASRGANTNSPSIETNDQTQDSQTNTNSFSGVREFTSEVFGRIRDTGVDVYENVSNIASRGSSMARSLYSRLTTPATWNIRSRFPFL